MEATVRGRNCDNDEQQDTMAVCVVEDHHVAVMVGTGVTISGLTVVEDHHVAVMVGTGVWWR